jgi:hypothetical protein
MSRSLLLAACLLAVFGVTASASQAGSERVRFFFYNPARTIECRFSFGAVACADFRHKRLVILDGKRAAQVSTIKAGFGTRNTACKSPPGDDPPCWFEQGGRGPILRVGATAVDPDVPIYKCGSVGAAIVCRSLLSGRGFRISSS